MHTHLPNHLIAPQRGLHNRLIGLLAALFLILATTYAVIIPPFEGFDALAHYGYVTYLRGHRQLPPLDRPTGAISYELIAHPPLYYALAALSGVGSPLDKTMALAAQSSNVYHTKVLSQRLSVTLPDQTLAALWPVWAARAVSMLGGLLALLGTWLLARTCFPAMPSLALAAAAVVGFNPQFLFAAANITNDALSAATNVFTVWLAARNVLYPQKAHTWFWVGVLAGLAALTKYSGPLLALPLLILMIYYWRKVGWRATGQAIGYALIGALLTGGWYYGRNLWNWGEVVPLTQMAQALPTLLRPEPFTIARTLEFIPWLIAAYWGVFVSVIASPAYLATTQSFMLVGGLGLLIWPWRARLRGYPHDRLVVLMALGWFGIFALSVLNWTRTVDFGEQGRLLLAASPALALLLIVGWQAWLPVRWHTWLHAAIVIFSLGLALSQIDPLYTAYHMPPAVEPPLTPDRMINAQFEAGMQLVGVDLPDGAAIRPGQPLPLTLYFSTPRIIDGFYTLFIHLADQQDRLLFQFDGVPAQGRHPTRQWLPGAIFADTYQIMLKTDQPLADGLVTLSLGFYRYDDKMARQPLLDAQGIVAGDRVVLAPVRVHAAAMPPTLAVGEPLARWANGIQLQTGQVVKDAADLPTAVQVAWTATQVVQTDYTVFVQMLSQDGQLLAQIDQRPQAGQFPTSTWQPGDVIEDVYTFDPSAASGADQWDQIIIGFYDATQQRLSLQTANAAENPDFFVLVRKDSPVHE